MALPLRLKNGTTVLVETAPELDAVVDDAADTDADLLPKGVAMGSGRVAARLPEKEFGEAVTVVEGIAEELSERLGQSEQRGSKGMRLKELELGVKVGFDAKGNVFIAGGSASASLELKLKWQLDAAESETPAS